MSELDQYADMIDSREVIERIEELETSDTLGADEAAELASLREFAAEASEVSDWPYGETFIRDSYFTTYAQELAEDIGAVDSEASWPAYCIDWERAARELRMDYTSYEFAGVTYWARA